MSTSPRPFERVSNRELSNWYRAQQNVGRLRQIQANFNLTRNVNRNAANLLRAERHLANLTNRITGMQRRTGIHLNRNMNRARAMAALVREVTRRIREAREFLRLMMRPGSLTARQTGRLRTPSKHMYYSNFL